MPIVLFTFMFYISIDNDILQAIFIRPIILKGRISTVKIPNKAEHIFGEKQACWIGK